MQDPKKQHPSDIVKSGVFETPMYTVTAMVNADMARDLLMYNREPEVGHESTNRKASKAVVSGYAITMLRGDWYLSPQPIVFSFKDPETMTPEEYEEMIDGQQRLKAVVLAAQTKPDIEVPFTLCFDAPSKAKWLLDMGKKRQPGDFLRMQGEANSGFLANAIRMLYAIENHQPFKSINLWRHVSLTPQQQTEFLVEHPELRDGLTEAKKTRALLPPHVRAVLYYMVSTEFGPFMAQQLFTGLATGANMDTSDARLKVREYISTKNAVVRGTKHRWDGFELLALGITAANAYLLKDDGYEPAATLRRLNAASPSFPKLLKMDEMPTTFMVPGNSDPNLDPAKRKKAS